MGLLRSSRSEELFREYSNSIAMITVPHLFRKPFCKKGHSAVAPVEVYQRGNRWTKLDCPVARGYGVPIPTVVVWWEAG